MPGFDRCVLAFCVLGSACGGSVAPGQPASSRKQAQTPAAATPQAPALLDAAGFGNVKLGRALPPAQALASRYYAGYYADAQPLEGFELGSGVLAIVDGGAFASFGTDHPGEPAPDAVRDLTLASGAAGTLTVSMIVVTDPAITTAGDVRVGTDFAALHQAFPGTSLRRLPPLWEDPTCLVETAGLAYFFDGCPRSDDEPPSQTARVVRIVARR